MTKYCDEAGDCAVPNVLRPRDLVFRPDLSDIKLYHHHSVFPPIPDIY